MVVVPCSTSFSFGGVTSLADVANCSVGNYVIDTVPSSSVVVLIDSINSACRIRIKSLRVAAVTSVSLVGY